MFFLKYSTSFKGLMLLAIAVLMGQLYSCQRPSLEELPFFRVYSRPMSIKLEKIHLRGEVENLGDRLPDEVGFWVNRNFDAIQSLQALGTLIVGQRVSEANFEAVFADFKPGENLYFRAYARLGERTIYGNVQSYLPNNWVGIEQAVAVNNDTALLYGVLNGIAATGDTVMEHGHVYSDKNPNPELGLSDCLYTQLGPSKTDYTFQSKIGGLRFNTVYTVRAYARGRSKTFYSQPVSVHIRDGWKKMPPLAYMQGAVATTNGRGKAYLGFGCPDSYCAQSALPNQFWAFSPTDTSGIWRENTPIDPLYLRTNVASFAIGDTVYYVTGEYFDGFCPSFCPVSQFIKFNTQTLTWNDKAVFAPSPPDLIRSEAVAFSLFGKGYVGSGESIKNDRATVLNDFWEYNPTLGHWRRVASLPLELGLGEGVLFQGRAEATSFVIGNHAYVVGGRFGTLSLKDCWRFDPTVSDTGRWEQVAFLPGFARYAGVGFSVGQKGYYGLGYNLNEGPLGDFWEYDPNTNTWSARTPFPAGKRYDAVAFALGQYGYVGTGNTRKIKPSGETNTVQNNDVWRYEPER